MSDLGKIVFLGNPTKGEMLLKEKILNNGYTESKVYNSDVKVAILYESPTFYMVSSKIGDAVYRITKDEISMDTKILYTLKEFADKLENTQRSINEVGALGSSCNSNNPTH